MFRLTATTLRATTIAIPILLATAIAIPSLLATSIAVPASAQQISVGIGFDNFHNQLAPHGTWSNHSRWGEVWQPRADRGFRPYSNGYWANTAEYGTMWISDDPWDVTYHYGRWVFDPRDGWLWVPGYVWGPSWVVWREGGGNIGWFPMPPDDYYGNGAYGGNFNNQYGYRDWYGPSFGNDMFLSLWIFVAMDRFGDRDYRNYILPPRDYGRIIVQTNDTTNYITINNYVVNRSIDENRLPRDRTQRFQPVPASNVLGRNALVTQATVGRQVEQRERQRRPIPASIDRSDQRGGGSLNSNAQQQKPNQPQQGLGGRDDDRGAASPAIDTKRQNDRSRANINPVEQRGRSDPAESAARQPNTNQTPQGLGDRGRVEPNSNGRAPSNPQTARNPRVTNTPPNGDAARQGLAERRNRDAAVPTTQATPAEKRGSQADPRTERGTGSLQSPQAREAPDQKGKVIVQDSRPTPRVQGNAPDANRQANTRTIQAQANKQGDTKNTDDQEKADEKKARADRGRN